MAFCQIKYLFTSYIFKNKFEDWIAQGNNDNPQRRPDEGVFGLFHQGGVAGRNQELKPAENEHEQGKNIHHRQGNLDDAQENSNNIDILPLLRLQGIWQWRAGVLRQRWLGQQWKN